MISQVNRFCYFLVLAVKTSRGENSISVDRIIERPQEPIYSWMGWETNSYLFTCLSSILMFYSDDI